MRAVLDILWHDVRARLRDRSAIVIGFVAPLALITVLSLIISGPDTEKQPIGVVAGGSPALQQALRRGVLDAMEREGVITVHEFPGAAAARAAVEAGDVDAAIVVGADGLDVVHGDAPVGSAMAITAARATGDLVDTVGRVITAERILGAPSGPSVAGVAARLQEAPSTVALGDLGEKVAGIDAKTQVASGLATFFLFFTVQFGVLSLLYERRTGTLARLLAAPVAPWQVLAAKVGVSFVLGLASMTALIVCSRLILGTHWGNPVGVALLTVCGVLAATSTVALVAGVARTPEAAGLAQSMVALVLGILGGSFFSMARAGGLSAVFTRLTPHHWFGEGLVRLTGGASWTAVLMPCLVLVLFAAVVGVPGALLARRAVRP